MLNRLRQTEACGIGVVNCILYPKTGAPINWSISASNLGETKSIADEASTQTFNRKTKVLSYTITKQSSAKARTPANFRQVRIGSVVRGNSRFDGHHSSTFVVPGYYPLIIVDGPVAATASTTLVKCPVLPWELNDDFIGIDPNKSAWCLQQAANAASEAVHDFGVTLGELVETVSFLLQPFKALKLLTEKHGLLSAVFRHDLKTNEILTRPEYFMRYKFKRMSGSEKAKGAARAGWFVVNESSDFWLSWRFGVKPLLKEIHDIMGMDFSSYESTPLALSRKRFADKWNYKASLNSTGLGNYVSADLEDRVKYRSSSQATYAYAVKHGFGVSDFLNAYGLTLRHLPGVLWELVPCSFVLDRFVGIGDFIKSLTPDPSVTTIDTCVSTKRELILDRKVTKVYRYGRPLANYVATKNNKFRIYQAAYSRDVGVSVPRIPQFNPKLLKIQQQVDHLALLWQRLPKWR